MIKKIINCCPRLLLMVLAIMTSAQYTLAAENMKLSGTLIEPPPCTINDQKMIDVDFGERIGINKVNGENYRQTLGYTIKCEQDSKQWETMLTVQGTVTSYDNAAVITNINNLGIQLLLNGKPFTLNTPFAIDPNNPPVLEAVPVKAPGVKLAEGAFLATATLQANYQ